ncbi:MAG: amidase [Hyphomicrobiaceae bacterium]
MTTLTGLTACEAAKKIRNGEITSVQLVKACLERIASREPVIGAWAYINPERALEQARAADAWMEKGDGVGPLHGVPVGIKDVIDTADMRTENGSAIFAGRQPADDAACVTGLRQAGAVILGKTVTTELASLTPSATRNSVNPEHSPGGSSAGSAAAVADGMAPLALGTQTAGSVIRPASFCGVYAMKPTLGLISRTGVLLQSHTLDTVGVFGRCVEDLGLIVDSLSAQDLRDSASYPRSQGSLSAVLKQPPPQPPKLAFCKTPAWPTADAATAEAYLALVRSLGERCQEIVLPAAFDGIVEAQRAVQFAENSAYYGPLLDRGREAMSAGMIRRLEQGATIPVRDYLQAIIDRELRYAELEKILAGFDAIICPAAPGPAPRGFETTGDPVFNGLWTYLGVPCVTLPLLDVGGLPLGVQLVGARRDDGRLLRTARWLNERRRPQTGG